MDWEREFLPWLASLPEEDRLEIVDLLLQFMAAKLDRKFQGQISRSADPEIAGLTNKC